MELVAELRAGGGRAREVRVRCAAEAGGELRALRRGLGELQERVAELLAPLVLEQQRRGGAPGGGDGLKEEEEGEEEDDDDDEDDDDEENSVEAARAELPPPKRTRVQPP
ncbi:transcription initiation factor IIA subunit 1-like [Numida meleagris]|uniref:transcription initiation factor IIA subunit 1-like n=1 Tax=Numida meleagris TaxID=8996 RepID=UPI000B3DE490|nr:transcription initiation factor IIA subunit 1-like [Numida meleagris]